MVYEYIIPTHFVDFNGKFVGIYRYTIYVYRIWSIWVVVSPWGLLKKYRFFHTKNGPRGGGQPPTCCSVDPTEATTFPEKKAALLTEARYMHNIYYTIKTYTSIQYIYYIYIFIPESSKGC